MTTLRPEVLCYDTSPLSVLKGYNLYIQFCKRCALNQIVTVETAMKICGHSL